MQSINTAACVVTAVFVVLKLAGILAWGWGWVLLPVTAMFALSIAIGTARILRRMR